MTDAYYLLIGTNVETNKTEILFGSYSLVEVVCKTDTISDEHHTNLHFQEIDGSSAAIKALKRTPSNIY